MRVNLVIPRLPLPFSGSDSRWFHVLASQLPRLDVDLVVIAVHEGSREDELDARAHAARWGYDLRVVHLSPPQGASGKLLRLARPRTELAQSVEVSTALRTIRREGGTTILSGISAPGVTSQLDEAVAEVHYLQSVDRHGEPWGSPASLLQRVQERRAERGFLREPRPLIVNSARMAQLISKWRSPSATTKLTIDPSLYRFNSKTPELTLGFIGSMFWEPSRRAAERLLLRVWPLVRAEVPHARLLIAGWQAEEHLGQLFPVEGAELVSTVARPADFFDRLTVLLFPPVGGTGMKIKTLEAMAYGVPVVTTVEGIEGIEDVPGAPQAVADDDHALASAAALLLEDLTLRREVAEAGRTTFEHDLDPTRASETFLAAALRATADAR